MLYTTQVMIADEDTLFTRQLCNTLEKFGRFSIVTTHTGTGLLDAVCTNCPDVLIIDLMLPGVNTLTILHELKSLPKSQCPCIFVLSAFSSPEAATECNRLGAAFLLRKPISPSALVDLVQRYGRRLLECKPTQSELFRHITKLLEGLHFPMHVMGYDYLRESIYMALDDPSSVDSVTKILYPSIAKKYHVTWTSVERDIRNAVSLAWTRSDGHFPGFHFSSRPANREFISTVSERIRFDLRLDTFEGIARA